MENNKLQNKKYVDVFIDKKDKKVLIGFGFKDDKGTLKLARNERGAGFISAHTIIRELATAGIPREKINKLGKDGFSATEETIESSKIFVVELVN